MFYPAKWFLAGNLVLPLDILPLQIGFGGESLSINPIPIQKTDLLSVLRSIRYAFDFHQIGRAAFSYRRPSSDDDGVSRLREALFFRQCGYII